jgi:hypothetical protein
MTPTISPHYRDATVLILPLSVLSCCWICRLVILTHPKWPACWIQLPLRFVVEKFILPPFHGTLPRYLEGRMPTVLTESKNLVLGNVIDDGLTYDKRHNIWTHAQKKAKPNKWCQFPPKVVDDVRNFET